MRRLACLFLGAAMAASTVQAQVAYRWFTASGMGGTLVAGIRNDKGSYFRLSCSAGAVDPEASLDYEPKGIPIRKGDTIQVVVDGDAFQFDLGDLGLAELSARTSRLELAKLVKKLTVSRSAAFEVETPRANAVEKFSLKDARKAIGLGRDSILSGCDL